MRVSGGGGQVSWQPHPGHTQQPRGGRGGGGCRGGAAEGLVLEGGAEARPYPLRCTYSILPLCPTLHLWPVAARGPALQPCPALHTLPHCRSLHWP